MTCSLGISNFLEEVSSLSHSIVFLCFFALIIGRLSYLSLLFFGTLHSDGCIFPLLVCLSLIFFSQLFVRPPQTTHFAFLHFFFLGMVLINASCTMLWTFVHSSLSIGTLSKLIPWIYLSLPLYNPKTFDLGHTWMVPWFSLPPFFNLSLNLAIRSSWSEPQSAPDLVFADCIQLLHLQLRRI